MITRFVRMFGAGFCNKRGEVKPESSEIMKRFLRERPERAIPGRRTICATPRQKSQREFVTCR